MAKSKRNRRAKNKLEGVSHDKLEGSSEGALIKIDPLSETEAAARRSNALRVVPSSTLFTAELEEVIEIIARERVYRAMLARLASRLLMAPPNSGDLFNS